MVHNRRGDDPATLFKLWFGLCALLAVAMVALMAWALIRIVLHFT